MEHQMGLVGLTMGTNASAVTTITYDGNTSTELYRSSGTTSTTSLALFDNFSPLNSSSTYYYIVKHLTAYTLNSGYKVTTTSGDPVYQWSQDITSSQIDKGKYRTFSPTPTFRNFARLYGFTNSEQTYTPLIANKTYLMECWGASGDRTSNQYYYGATSSYNPHPGKGGYTYATTTLSSTSTLFVYVGSTYQRFNGGGDGQPRGADASHIATVTGKLSTLSGQQDKVLIVAGGAGGASDNSTGGYGGGLTGGDGSATSPHIAPTGGSATEGGEWGYYNKSNAGEKNYYGGKGSFGQGGAGWFKTLVDGVDMSSSYQDPGGGGGGGWYGGGGMGGAGGGAGGSGHVKTGLTGNTIAGDQNVPDPNQHSTIDSGPYEYVTNYVDGNANKTYASPLGHCGDGYARITIMPYD